MSKLSTRQKVLNILPYIFLHWLIENKLLTKYLDNVVNDTTFSKEKIMKVLEYCCKEMPMSILMHSFHWSKSKEGRDFWRERDHEWSDIIIYNLIKKSSKEDL